MYERSCVLGDDTMFQAPLPFRLSTHCFLMLCLLLMVLSFGSLASAESFFILSTEDYILSRPVVPSTLKTDEFDEAGNLASSFPRHSSLNTLRLSADGVVRSRNPVWNICISGKPIRKGLIMRNTDTFEYRRGHLHLRIPFSCRDYHRGNVSIWKHPDFPDLDVLLDAKGRLIGGVPFSYIAVRD